MKINETLVKQLIQEQFPQWQGLPIQAVAQGGGDNYTCHLGQDMLVRLPRDAEHASPILKEYQWLQVLTRKLSYTITTPIALGKPSKHYPWHWCINRWIEGYNTPQNSDHRERDKNVLNSPSWRQGNEYKKTTKPHGRI